jgi:hypothetical protein
MKVTGYKIDRWINTETLKPMFGIKAKVGRKWFHLSEQRQALIFDDMKSAENKITLLNAKSSFMEA